MEKLIKLVDDLLSKINGNDPIRESFEWYLRNNLADYKSAILAADSNSDVKNPTLALSRFCTESMNWDDPMFKECTKITEAGRNVAKA